jgi:putative NADH-flavin reductase
MSSRLLVLGATGNTGGHIIDLALARGHKVTAFVRSPHKIVRRHDALTVIEGDVLSPDQLAQALRGHDAVVSAIGPKARDAFRPSTLLADCATSTVAAMKQAGVRRLAIVSAAVLFPEKGLSFRLFRWLLRHHARDLLAMEAVVAASGLEWTIARPPRLVRSQAEGYVSARGVFPNGGSVMSFRAVAAFLLDSVDQGTFAREIIGLARPARSLRRGAVPAAPPALGDRRVERKA